jgi:beta-phosphoglucomutase-like phosphatase (HAD superfamily)
LNSTPTFARVDPRPSSGVLDGMRCVCTGDEVERGKPDPEIFRLAASRLGVDPARCVVIEDTPLGVRAAKAAGMHGAFYCTLVPIRPRRRGERRSLRTFPGVSLRSSLGFNPRPRRL